jgi:hypothetical protein
MLEQFQPAFRKAIGQLAFDRPQEQVIALYLVQNWNIVLLVILFV